MRETPEDCLAMRRYVSITVIRFCLYSCYFIDNILFWNNGLKTHCFLWANNSFVIIHRRIMDYQGGSQK